MIILDVVDDVTRHVELIPQSPSTSRSGHTAKPCVLSPCYWASLRVLRSRLPPPQASDV